MLVPILVLALAAEPTPVPTPTLDLRASDVRVDFSPQQHWACKRMTSRNGGRTWVLQQCEPTFIDVKIHATPTQ